MEVNFSVLFQAAFATYHGDWRLDWKKTCSESQRQVKENVPPNFEKEGNQSYTQCQEQTSLFIGQVFVWNLIFR